MRNIELPSYRVRLFLSVDLTGSTAYKHNSKSNNSEWTKVFNDFYKDFPELLKQNYYSVCEEFINGQGELVPSEKEDGAPKIWKTIGDEILFLTNISSLCHLSSCIKAFIKTLKEFGKTIDCHQLNTKGNAWVCSFPTPNHSFRTGIFSSPGHATDISILSESQELEVDKNPHHFDFLGKGIDAGFRISKNSSIDKLTISPGLALLLCECRSNKQITKFEENLWFDETQVFKGVANGSNYPVITINTFRDEKEEQINELERFLLHKNNPADIEKLTHYLTKFMEKHNIEIPKVKRRYGAILDIPDFYKEFIKRVETAQNQNSNQDISIAESAAVPTNDLSSDLTEQKEVADQLIK